LHVIFRDDVEKGLTIGFGIWHKWHTLYPACYAMVDWIVKKLEDTMYGENLWTSVYNDPLLRKKKK